MKSILRTITMYAFSLYMLPKMLGGFHVTGGIATVIFGGMVLTLMSFVVRPVLNIISFPLNFITLGLFSALTNVLILYLLTVMVPNISISAFQIPGYHIAGFIVPKMMLNSFFAFVASAFVLAAIISFINWLNS